MMTKEEIIKKYGIENIHFFENGDYFYTDKKGIRHLMRKNKELCQGRFVFSYENGDSSYEDENGIEHLIRYHKELCQGSYVFSYENGYYEFIDENDILHLFNENGEKIKEIKNYE